MLDRRWLLAEPEVVAAKLARRGIEVDLEPLVELDRRRRATIATLDELRHERKVRSQEIGRIARAGGDVEAAKAEVRALGERIRALEADLTELEEQIEAELLRLPNVPLDEVPDGVDEGDNVVVRTWGEPRQLPFTPRPHWELGEHLGIIDLERAARVSGARFAFMRGLGARLEWALADWMLSLHAAAGYEEVLPPYLVRGAALVGTGQLPKFAEELFKVEERDLYLIPTAEVPVTNLYAGELLHEEELPRRFVAFSPCFRAEAGAAGRDTRGIIRVHQFHKVELVHYERPEESRAGLERLLAQAERVLQELDLPYRVVELCAGDLGFSAALTYDLEVWLPGQGRWLEVSSCSTFTDYQARRANLRYRPAEGGKPRYLHTLNGSALAVGRTVVAILENYQNADGSVTIPAVLRDRMGADTIEPSAGEAPG